MLIFVLIKVITNKMENIEKILRKKTVNLFSDDWYESTVRDILKINNNQKGYVYFIKGNGKSDLIKIGYSVNLNSRLSSLKTGFGDGLYLIGYIYCHDFMSLESELHKILSERRKVGEWFLIPISRAKRIIREKRGIVVDGYYNSKSNIIDGMFFNFSNDKNFFVNKDYYEPFFNYVESLSFETKIPKSYFYNEIKKINKDYSVLSAKKCNIILKKYCENKDYKYIEYNANGERGFIISNK